MNKFFMGVLGLALLGGTGAGWVLHATAGMVTATEDFFLAVKHQDLVKARALLAQETSQKLDDLTLRKLMETDSMTRFSELSFPNRTISGDHGEMSGTLKTTSGGVVPVRVALVKEAGTWKVYGFQTGN